MKISAVHLRVFGGITDLGVEFQPGLNIVLGDNESGKSTLFRAIQHTLLTATNLDKRALRKELDPFLPRPDGNFAECTISVEGDGSFTVRRRWGADAEEEATMPDGTIVRGPEDVSRAIDRFLPVSSATFRTILLADQTQLDQTARLLEENPGARDEAAAALRSARLAAGGVSPDAFARLLEERLSALLGRWDTARDRPEGGRGYTEPWTRGAGTLVKAFYGVQKLEADLDAVVRSETELDQARSEMEQTGQTLRVLDSFISEHGAAHAELNTLRGLNGEIAANEERLKRLREDNRRWPVLQKGITDLESEAERLTAERAALETELAAVRERERRNIVREKLDRVDRLLHELAEAGEDRDATALVDEKALSELKEVEAQLPYAEARLSSGHLRAIITAKKPRPITVTVDGSETTTQDAVPDAPVDLSASRQLLIETEELRIQIESGEERFEDLSNARNALIAERDRLQNLMGVRSVAEAESRRLDRDAATARVTQLEQTIVETMSVADLQAAEAARNELARQATAPEPADDRTPAAITDALAAVSEQLGAVNGKLGHSREELLKLQQEYDSQEDLENSLGETNRVLSELTSRRDGKGSVPGGFETAAEFLEAYENKTAEKDLAAGVHGEARVSYAELVGSQPEQNSDEIGQELGEARAVYDRLHREAHSIERVRKRAEQVIGDLDAAVFDPFMEKVAAYAGVVTGSAYSPEPGDDPLSPERFLRIDGTAQSDGLSDSLPYMLLSQGTKDSLALAVRLALAETALGTGSAPFILDDPLVDMDPSRRAAAAGALSAFAEHPQVIVLTCHPEHAALFPDSHRISLSIPQPR
ncbi:MAG: AAA family ATPase [Spirochaetales bacterium]|nr:AAA family ATPase [Spirochaetales bacterium]